MALSADDQEIRDAYRVTAAKRAKLFVVTGTLILIAGTQVKKDQEVFITVGFVVLSFAAYFLWVALKLRSKARAENE
jgi:hypothetical protein